MRGLITLAFAVLAISFAGPVQATQKGVIGGAAAGAVGGAVVAGPVGAVVGGVGGAIVGNRVTNHHRYPRHHHHVYRR